MKLIAIALFLIGSSQLYAQGLHVGIKAGADVQKISGSKLSEQFAYGYDLGVFGEININSAFGIQPELYYSSVSLSKGSSLDTIYQSLNLSTVSKIKFDYLNVPILLNIKPSKHFSLQAGPRFGILADKNSSIKSNTSNALKNGDVSMVAGIQIYFSNLRFYGRYQSGLGSINNVGDITNNEKWKTASYHVGVALKLL